jgi:hypothetical protein
MLVAVARRVATGRVVASSLVPDGEASDAALPTLSLEEGAVGGSGVVVGRGVLSAANTEEVSEAPAPLVVVNATTPRAVPAIVVAAIVITRDFMVPPFVSGAVDDSARSVSGVTRGR